MASSEFAGWVEEELFPCEEAAASAMVVDRCRSFGSGRACARRALALLGIPPQAICRGEEGEPLWPVGVVGSVTHCVGYTACAVGRDTDVRAVGIDVEPAESLDADVLAFISVVSERAMLTELAVADPTIPWDRLLFSAKEAVYKAWYPLRRTRLDFEDVTVRLDWEGGLGADVVTSHDSLQFAGRWVLSSGLVAAAVVLPA